jgi:hypothetical protein
MIDWIQGHQAILWWLAVLSIITFVATLVAAPLLVLRIPSDYFAPGRHHRKLWTDRHPLVRGMLMAGKNLLGCVFIGTGILMLVLPGQGVLTILAGIMLLNFPGKYRLERWVVTRPQVLQSINWLRRRAGRVPLFLGS